MSDGRLPFGVPDALAGRADHRWEGPVGWGLLDRLTGADYLSLAALFFAWTSAVLLLDGHLHWGIGSMFAAFLFDKLDGYYARTRGVSSPFGRRVDSFIDVFAYLVTAALIYHVALSPAPWVTVLVGFAILTFGGLRLVRHADEGFGETDGTDYYVGWTVVHVNFVVLLTFYLDLLVGVSGWLAAVPVVAVCPLMVSGYRSYKTTLGHALAAGVVLTGLAISLAAEFTGAVG
jgi:CDP-diacylglycerol--serine O-phosphatidyltransferase